MIYGVDEVLKTFKFKKKNVLAKSGDKIESHAPNTRTIPIRHYHLCFRVVEYSLLTCKIKKKYRRVNQLICYVQFSINN